MADKKEDKKEKSNRFAYDSDLGLSIVSKGEVVKEDEKKEEKQDKR